MSQNGDFNNLGNGYITFGLYPQSKKSTNCIVGSRANRRGFYMGGDGELYGKAGDEYYKVEPIKWKIISCNNEELIVVADKILDSHRFDEDDNNYVNSEIRKWLNNDFYNSAFNEEQKAQIVTTMVDNSLSSTGDNSNKYTCGNTSDKVFLLSRKEAERYFASSSDRQKNGTDYAKARNLYFASNGNSYWWLRSPFDDHSNNAQHVYSVGDIYYYSTVTDSDVGVFPALKINVNSDMEEIDEETKAGLANLIKDFLSLSHEDRQKVIEDIKNGDLKL